MATAKLTQTLSRVCCRRPLWSSYSYSDHCNAIFDNNHPIQRSSGSDRRYVSTTPNLSRFMVKRAYKGPESEPAEVNFGPPDLENESIITVPIHLKKRLEKKMIRDSTRGAERQRIIDASRMGNKSKVIIYCKHAECNHYLGTSYEKDSEIPLASKSWHHRKAAGDWFVIKPQHKAQAFGFPGVETRTFEDLGVKSDLIQRLKDNKALKPTLIQQIAIPQILKESHNLLTAETGCGKTLAYLVPLMQQILVEKRRRLRRRANHPLALIFVPSHELASQIFYVATKLSEGLGVNVKLLEGGNLGSKIASPPSQEIDLLISTVHVFSQMKYAGIYGIGNVKHLVLDEADTLLDDSFSSSVVDLMKSFQFDPTQPNAMQLTLCSATLPKSVETTVGEVVPEHLLNRISTPNIHYVMSHVPQHFLRLKKNQKPDKLLEIVKEDVKNNVPLMIFCNKTSTCDWLWGFLKDNNITSTKVHGKTHPSQRKGRLDIYQSGETNILICTDLGSRGINTVRTQHVLNYEFPMFTADYIHRCGRTGRVGSTGACRITSFVSRVFEFKVVQEIERSVRKEISIAKVDGNIKRLLTARYGMFQPIVADDDTEFKDSSSR